MRCRSPEQHRRKGTTNSHTGNSTSTSLCTTSSPSLSSVCRSGGEGEGALWFPVLWVILPHRPCGSLSCGSMCSRSPPLAKARGLAWGGSYVDDVCLLEREAWLGGGGGGYHGGGGACDAATLHHIYIYATPPQDLPRSLLRLYPEHKSCIPQHLKPKQSCEVLPSMPCLQQHELPKTEIIMLSIA